MNKPPPAPRHPLAGHLESPPETTPSIFTSSCVYRLTMDAVLLFSFPKRPCSGDLLRAADTTILPNSDTVDRSLVYLLALPDPSVSIDLSLERILDLAALEMEKDKLIDCGRSGRRRRGILAVSNRFITSSGGWKRASPAARAVPNRPLGSIWFGVLPLRFGQTPPEGGPARQYLACGGGLRPPRRRDAVTGTGRWPLCHTRQYLANSGTPAPRGGLRPPL
ncbi:hypothetical protein KSP40_PGU001713 [Platanthera guangdongensis]|uniref:Uncharacterized protein n=1 Tax=Platanthera guangdongensis TaxID=2320717 RepID=A0ABR2M8E1_9ASPA